MSELQGKTTLELRAGNEKFSLGQLSARILLFDCRFPRHFSRLFENLYLLYALTVRGIRGRYKQSILGVGWALLTPAAMAGVFSYVITRTGLNQAVAYPVPLPLYALCLLTFWNYFQRAVTNGSTALVSNMDLVTKVYFPREVLPISAVLTNLVDWAVAFVMFALVAAGYTWLHPEMKQLYPHTYPFFPHLYWLWMPVFLALITLFTLGLVFFAATLQVYFRDISHLVNLGLFLWLFVTPVLYPLATLKGGRVSSLIIFNPMTGLIDGIQLAMLKRQFPWESHVVYAAIFALCFFLAGYAFFKHEERYFADVV